MGLQPHRRAVDTTAVPASEAIHLGGAPSVKGPSMQRFAAVWHASPQKMVGILFALLLAAMMAVGSGANFNSTSANPGNVVTAGNLARTRTTGAAPDRRQDQAGRDASPRHRHDREHRRHRRRLHGRQHGRERLDGARAVQPVRRARSTSRSGHRPTARRSTTACSAAMSAADAGTIAPGDTQHVHFAVTFLDGGRRRRRQRLQGRVGRGRLRLGGRQQLGHAGGRTPCPGPPPAGSPRWRPAGWGVSSCWRASLVLAATFLPSLFGYQRYVLVGHSMEPTIHKGSLVFDEIVPAEALRRGDVITYIPPTTKEPVTHRILSIGRGPHGERVFRTKGDNNAGGRPAAVHAQRAAPGPRRLRDPLPRLAVHPARDAGGADLPDRAAGRAAGAVGALRRVAPGRRAAGRGARASRDAHRHAAAGRRGVAGGRRDARAARDALRRALQLRQHQRGERASRPTRPRTTCRCTRSRRTRPA